MVQGEMCALALTQSTGKIKAFPMDETAYKCNGFTNCTWFCSWFAKYIASVTPLISSALLSFIESFENTLLHPA